MTNKLTKNITYCGLFIAISIVGAMFPVYGSIAFDSLAGFFAALFLGPSAGAIVCGLGHIGTAAINGFPYSLPLHILVMIGMAIAGYSFGFIYRKINWLLAIIIAILINGPILTLMTVPVTTFLGIEPGGWMLFKILLPTLTLVSAINIVFAYIIFKVIGKRNFK